MLGALVDVAASGLVVLELEPLGTAATGLLAVSLVRVRAIAMDGGWWKTVSRVLSQPPPDRASAVVSAWCVGARVGARVLPRPALVHVHAGEFRFRECVSNRAHALVRALEIHAFSGTIVISSRAFVHVDAASTVLAEDESLGTVASVGSVGVGARETAIGRPVPTLVHVLAGGGVRGQLVSRGAVADGGRGVGEADVGAGGVGAGVREDAGDAVVGQGPSGEAGATVGGVLVDADVGALVIPLQALVDVPTPAFIVLPQSLGARGILAGEAVLEKRETVGAEALVASQRVGAFVGAIVLVLQALVEILASPPVLVEDETVGAAAFERISTPLARVGTIGETAGVEGDAQPLVLGHGHAEGTGARVRALKVDALVGALVSPFQALVRVLADPRIVAQQVTRRATAFESALLVRALVRATVSTLVAFVYVHAIEETFLRDPITFPTRASVIPYGIDADLLASVNTVQTLVHVGTSPVVVVQSEPGSTIARVTPLNVDALVLAIVNVVGALVHVRAIVLVVLQCLETLGAGARESTLEIHAGVRARVHSALVRVHAAHLVLVDAITQRADAYRPILRLSALVRAGSRQCLATPRPRTGEIVLLQGEPRRTGALERALGVVAAVGARSRSIFALVDVVARHAVFAELETQMAGAVVTAWLVHAPVLAAWKLPFVRAFVDICWKLENEGLTFRKFEVNIKNCGV